jgi:hypothetical protein
MFNMSSGTTEFTIFTKKSDKKFTVKQLKLCTYLLMLCLAENTEEWL